MNEIIAVSITVVTIAGALTALEKLLFKPLRGIAKKFVNFFKDWEGEEERPGHPATKGVMVRMDDQHQQLEDLNRRAKRTEWHVGNGNPEPLRQLVEGLQKDVKVLKEQAEK